MQNQLIQQFASRIQLTMPDMVNRRVCVPYLIGMALASHLKVAIGADLSGMTAFADAHAGNVNRIVSVLNEQMVIDVKAVIQATRDTYMARHRIANGVPPDFTANPEFDLLSIVFGFSQVMPLEVYNQITKTGMAANQVYSAALMLFAKLKEDKTISI